MGGKVIFSFTNGEKITVDQFVTAVGPKSDQIATEEKEAGPIAILGGPAGIKRLLRPIYDLGKSYSDEVFATVLGLQSEDQLLEVIGAAAFRTGRFVDDTQEAIDRLNALIEEKAELERKQEELENSTEVEQRLIELKHMLRVFNSVEDKFNNTRKADSKSVIVAEQLGSLNSTIEAINRVNAVINDETGETEEKVREQIERDGVNVQLDAWASIQRYILMHWETFSAPTNLEEAQKQRLAEKAAKAVVKARGLSSHPHGITWEVAISIINKKLS